MLWRKAAFRDSALWLFPAARAMPFPHRNPLSATMAHSESSQGAIEIKGIYRKSFSSGLRFLIIRMISIEHLPN